MLTKVLRQILFPKQAGKIFCSIGNKVAGTLFLVTAVMALTTYAAQAQNPRPGYYEYGNYSELVLPQPAAKMLAQDLANPSDDTSYATGKANEVVNSALQGLSQDPRSALLVGVLKALKMGANYFYWVPTHQMLYNSSDPAVEVVKFREWYGIPYWSDQYFFPDGKLLREQDHPEVYVMIGRAKLHVDTGDYFGGNWNSIQIVPNGRLDGISRIPISGTLVREVSHPEVYVVAWGQIDPRYTWVNPNNNWGWVRRHIMNEGAIFRMGKSWNDVRVVPNGSLSWTPPGYDWY